MGLPALSNKWISFSFLALLLVYFALTFSLESQGATTTETECNRQTLSPVDCPLLSSEDEVPENDIDEQLGNIEEQIPSVIPFP
jgi:hypothetical protein